MADQDEESATGAFLGAARKTVTDNVSSAARGVGRAVNAAKNAFGLAPGPGGDNANFPGQSTN